MTRILTIVIEQTGEQAMVHHFSSEGLTSTLALAALQVVAGQLQKAAIEEEVVRRLAAEKENDDTVDARHTSE